MDVGLGQHAVVLELRLAKRRGISGDDDELGLSGSQRLKGALVSKGDLSGLHNKPAEMSVCNTSAVCEKEIVRKARVDAVGGLLGFLSCWCHRGALQENWVSCLWNSFNALRREELRCRWRKVGWC